MTIAFKPLHESYFPLLLKWLEAPHVKKWWDRDVTYTSELVCEKYSSYVQGYQLEGGVQKPIQAFIIYIDENPVGYIQIYNAYDFSRSKLLSGLPESLGAFDIFIGEEAMLNQGLGSKIISEFLKLHGNQYSYIFVDPGSNHISAVKCYERAGFKKISEQTDTREVWMIKDMNMKNFPKVGLGVLIFNSKNQLLLGKRKNAHGASSWGPPGGHLEFGESLEECAIREVLEETGVVVQPPIFLAITNDIFKEESKHYVSIFLQAHLSDDQIVQNLEPHKVENWEWFHLNDLPDHLFLPLKNLFSGFGYGQKLAMQNLQTLEKL